MSRRQSRRLSSSIDTGARDVRRRFLEALASGASQEKAVAAANRKAAPAPAKPAGEPVGPVSDMTWPVLRRLAFERLGADARTMNREQIEAALAARDA